MLDAMFTAATQTWEQFKYIAPIYLIGLVLESLRPAQARQPLGNIAFNLRYVVLFLFLTNLFQPPLQRWTQPWIATLGGGWLKVAFPPGLAYQILQVLLFAFVVDFLYYWFHRLQHVSGVLWAQHQIHHSEQSLNITTNNRHHWLEELLRVFLILFPLGVLFDFAPVTNAWIWAVVGLYGYFIHLNLRIELGPLTPVLVGPQAHRIHHSIEAQHRDRNFAAFFPIFDIVFGTYHRPVKGEFPATGLHDGRTFETVTGASVAPFRDWWHRLRGIRAARAQPLDQHPD